MQRRVLNGKTRINTLYWGHEWLLNIHEDVTTWKHFPYSRPFLKGIHRSRVASSHKGSTMWSFGVVFVVSFIQNLLENKHYHCRWLDTPWRTWRHCNIISLILLLIQLISSFIDVFVALSFEMWVLLIRMNSLPKLITLLRMIWF